MDEYRDMIDRIMSQISGTSVEAVFGESRQIGDKVIIPIGKVSYGWGGGGGRGKQPGVEGEGAGGGLGMGVKVKPVGFITVTADKVTYEPIIDLAPIIIAAGSILGLAMLKMIKHKSKCLAMGGRQQH